jgi:poly-gamma-glutamate synthesis protein (capsule biosynthesis protein)
MRKFFVTLLLIAFCISLPLASAHAAALTIVQNPVTFGYATATTTRTVDTIIVHATYNPSLATQTFAGALAEWKAENVSPHYAIDRAGTIYQLVAEKNIAWHAGTSALPNGDTNVNTRSIGIEMIYSNKDTPSAAQYASLQALIKNIEGRYNIGYILGHSEIAPGRKVDPWNFDYTKITSIFKPATAVFTAPATLSSTIFQSATAPLTIAQQSVMQQYSYRTSCPVSLADLRAVNVSYIDFNGNTQQGTLVVNASVAPQVVDAFQSLFNQKFPIHSIQPIDEYEGMDDMSVASDNTSAFNCRPVAGTTTFSQHAYGLAIDINPKENPSGSTATKLNTSIKGTITSAVVSVMKTAGFQWGGNWTSKKDYQHFSTNGK